MTYTDDFLISELQRFYNENSKVPTMLDMQGNDYPNFATYQNHFKTWNNALEAANLPLNQYQDHWRDGTETCCKCGCYKKENQGWVTKGLSKDEVMCHNCYNNPNYKNGKLNKESSTGKATISEQVVKNVLSLEERYDCNFACGFGYKVDLYHKDKYKYINVKDSVLYYDENKSPRWNFGLNQKVIPDTYVMLGYDEDRKNILRVWITDAVDDFVFNENTRNLLKKKSISDTYESLKEAEPWEVDAKPYNDMLHKMSQKRKDSNGDDCFLNNDDLEE